MSKRKISLLLPLLVSSDMLLLLSRLLDAVIVAPVCCCCSNLFLVCNRGRGKAEKVSVCMWERVKEKAKKISFGFGSPVRVFCLYTPPPARADLFGLCACLNGYVDASLHLYQCFKHQILEINRTIEILNRISIIGDIWGISNTY